MQRCGAARVLPRRCAAPGSGFSFLCLFFDRLDDRAILLAWALEDAGEFRPGERPRATTMPIASSRVGSLLTCFDALVADIDFAVEEDAAKLDLFVGLLFVQQHRAIVADAAPCRRSRRSGPSSSLSKPLSLLVAGGALGQRILHHRHPQPFS